MSYIEYRDIKIEVGDSKEKSELIQKKLFDEGCSWTIHSDFTKHTDKKYIFVDDYGTITWSNDEAWFDKSTKRELVFKFKSQLVVDSISERKPRFALVNGEQFSKKQLLSLAETLED